MSLQPLSSPFPPHMSSLQTPPPYKAPAPQQKQPIAQEVVQWETFCDDDEALSLCDLPVRTLPTKEDDGCKSPEAVEEFEFRTFCGGDGPSSKDMCAADDVFFQGQLLPLRPSTVSTSRCGSRSDSSIGFDSSSSSTTISRSHSSNSYSSNCDAAPRLSVSNNFYAHPSPSPQVRRSSRKSTGSAPPGWGGLFRLGVVKAPEIELHDLRSRRARATTTAAATTTTEAKTKPLSQLFGVRCGTKERKAASRFGFGCKCAPDAVEPVEPIGKLKKKEGAGLGLESGESMQCRSRMFEWLEELSLGKGPVGYR